VLHVTANFRTGGSTRLVVDLVEHLGSEYEQRAITQDYPSVRGYEGVALDEYPDLTSARPIGRLLERFRPDIVHIHYVAYQLLAMSDRDYRWYIHVFEAAEQSGARVIENVNVPTAPYRSEAVDRYVYVSDYVKRRYARPGDRATVIYPGSDLARFRQAAEQDGSHDTVGLVYRLEPDKLDESSLDPIIEVLRRRADSRALVVGGGMLLPGYQRAAAEAGIDGRVSFTGYVAYDDLPALYQQMTAFVAPVHTESFGHVSVLAMATELPVAGYNVGALEEMLGGSELLATPGDAQGLADILVGLLDDPDKAHAIGVSNRRRAEENFTVERMIEGYRTLYEELAGSARRSS